MATSDQSTMMILGQIKGQLDTLQSQIDKRAESTDQRIDDMAASIGKRIEDQRRHSDQRFKSIEDRQQKAEERITTAEKCQLNSKKTTAIWGGGSSAIMLGLVEVLKALTKQ